MVSRRFAFLGFLVLAWIYRIWLTHGFSQLPSPIELVSVLEPAFGLISSKWVPNAEWMRGEYTWFLPGLISLPLRILDALDINDPTLVFRILQCGSSLFSLMSIGAAWVWAHRLNAALKQRSEVLPWLVVMVLGFWSPWVVFSMELSSVSIAVQLFFLGWVFLQPRPFAHSLITGGVFALWPVALVPSLVVGARNKLRYFVPLFIVLAVVMLVDQMTSRSIGNHIGFLLSWAHDRSSGGLQEFRQIFTLLGFGFVPLLFLYGAWCLWEQRALRSELIQILGVVGSLLLLLLILGLSPVVILTAWIPVVGLVSLCGAMGWLSTFSPHSRRNASVAAGVLFVILLASGQSGVRSTSRGGRLGDFYSRLSQVEGLRGLVVLSSSSDPVSQVFVGNEIALREAFTEEKAIEAFDPQFFNTFLVLRKEVSLALIKRLEFVRGVNCIPVWNESPYPFYRCE